LDLEPRNEWQNGEMKVSIFSFFFFFLRTSMSSCFDQRSNQIRRRVTTGLSKKEKQG